MGLFRRSKDKDKDSKLSTPNTPTFPDGIGYSGSDTSLKSPTTLGNSTRTMSLEAEMALPKPPDPATDPAGYLRSIYAVRDRTRIVFELARRDQLKHFDVDMSKMGEVAAYVCSIIRRDYAPHYNSIPPHGRWQHFDVGGRPRVDQLLATWPSTIDNQERTRRLLDLFLVSVLLDAGAGTRWSYKSKESGKLYRRSEGLAVASLEMFKAGMFSSDESNPHRVDARGLRRLTVEKMAKGLQVSPENPIEGLEGRAGVIMRLADALAGSTEVYGVEGRVGNLLDFLLSHPTTQANGSPLISLPTLWDTLMSSLAPIWPDTRTCINGVSLGDAWPCVSMPNHPTRPWENIVPFHKLTQWLTYSLMVPMEKMMGIRFMGTDLMTGLPEYRNGGLFVDCGVLTLKDEETKRGLAAWDQRAKLRGGSNVEVVPVFPVGDDVIVEWRAVTVGLLDALLLEVNTMLDLKGDDSLSLAQMLEAGSWKGGREIAEIQRPNTKEPPIMILSDGTVF